MKQKDEMSVGKLKFILNATNLFGWVILLLGVFYLLESLGSYFYSIWLRVFNSGETWLLYLLLLLGLVLTIYIIRPVCFIFTTIVSWIKRSVCFILTTIVSWIKRPVCFILTVIVGWIKFIKGEKQKSSSEGLHSNDVKFLDAPIDKAIDDVFYRGVYVRKLASLIEHFPKEKAGYIGVYGEWGEGKTSVRNLLEEHFKDEESKINPLFLNFSPWEYPEKTDLRSVFFEVISEKLAYNNIRTISKIFSLLSKGFKIRRINNELGALHECLDWIRNLFNITFSNDKLIECAKQELKKMNRRIIIVVDDLDRLTNEEVCQVLRFLKANGDLPNMVYLILADENHLADAIKGMVGGNGREFIEKIIPFSCPLPPIDRAFFKHFLQQEIVNRLATYGLTFPKDDNAYDCVLEYALTPRKLKRLVDTFAIELAGLKLQVAGRRFLNVHLGDLLVLTAVKLFEPECYRRLYPMVKYIESTVVWPKEGVTPEWLEEQLMKYVNPKHKEWFKDFIETRLGITLKKEISRGRNNEHKYILANMDDDQCLSEYRLASRHCFPNYFLVPCEKLLLQQEDLEQFEEQIRQQKDVQELLLKFDKEGTLAQLLDVLDTFEAYSDVKISKFFIKSLVQLTKRDLTPLIYSSEYILWKISIYEKIYLSILHYCRKFKNARIRGGAKIGDELLLHVLMDCNDIIVTSYCLSYEAREHDQDEASYDALFSNSGYKMLQQFFLRNIIEMQRKNELLNHPEFKHLLNTWQRALSDCQDFIPKSREVCRFVIEDEATLQAFLSPIVDEDLERMDEAARVFTFSIERLESFFGEDDIKLIATKLQQDGIFADKWKEMGTALEWALNEKENDQDYSCEAQRQFILNKRNNNEDLQDEK